MNQQAGKGRGVSVYLEEVTAEQVLNNNRLKIVKQPLKDWIVCTNCRHQQLYHCRNGADFDTHCWNCLSDKSFFVYMDELASELDPDQTIFRLKR
jgi:Zn finger protein HypA/HybF involved in hydrogenase expression